ncbi:hypothetical protein OC846_000407 [Tilletia horrida]|uniref:NAD(P)-binding protein n=1 Tax=Tilletia horrida TaxID=155126 RepID=A0AAN6JU00_9BASI|nr:hypothetical protein OC846_000407 [Tilletia horrida]
MSEANKPRNPRAAAVTLPNKLLLAHAEAGGLKSVVVLITGGASGLGKNTALRFAQYGAKVVIVDRSQQGLDLAAKEARAAGGDVLTVRADVTSWDDQAAAFQAAERQFGPISIVVANAGITDVETFYPEASEDLKVPKRPNLTTVDVNIKGVLYTSRLALHYLRKGDLTSYSVSKAGVLGLHRSLALDALMNGDAFAGSGLRIIMIAPFFVRTPLINDFISAGRLDHVKNFAQADDVSAAILHASAPPSHPAFKGEENAAARVRHGAAYCVIDQEGSLVIPFESLNNSLIRAHPEFGKRLNATVQQAPPKSKI